MDNEFHELEAELKGLRPRAPSALLTRRVAGELRAAPTTRSRRTKWGWAALPLAATLAGVVFFQGKTVGVIATTGSEPKVIAAATTTYKPVSADHVLYDLRDEGLVTLQDGTAARRYRGAYVDTITWKNPRTQASLRWSVPRTEERVVPVNFQ